MQNALVRVPALETAPIKTFLNGPESFTPDNNFILGEAPEVRGIFVAAGFNSMGIASGGGAGRALAEWIVGGEPSLDLWPVDIRRFARFHNNKAWLKERVKEVLGLHYAMPWPNRELESARPFRRSPLYDRLAASGAVFGSKMGWERANFFAAPGEPHTIRYSFGRQNWFDRVGEEHRAARKAVALFDMTSFAKFMVQGPGAEETLQYLCANDVAVPVGQTVYTPLLNKGGGFESDVTVARLAQDSFLLVTGTAQATRDRHWILRNGSPTSGTTVTDVTSAFAVLGLMGPHSRTLLSRVTKISLDNTSLPFGSFREISIGHATVLASRRSYVGELGWELYVPTEFAVLVYDSLVHAGADLGLAPAGYYAIDSLRIEKGYRAWGRELTPDVTPWQAGLGFAVALDKGGDFLGRSALLNTQGKPLTKRLVSFLGADPDTPIAWGGELIRADGAAVGDVTSAAYGHTLGGIVGLGWLNGGEEPIDADWIARRRFTVDIAGVEVPIRCQLRPFYDPTSGRMRV
jgi:4-methylaminobutanoate oxidase (formaldehyde-forming)